MIFSKLTRAAAQSEVDGSRLKEEDEEEEDMLDTCSRLSAPPPIMPVDLCSRPAGKGQASVLLTPHIRTGFFLAVVIPVSITANHSAVNRDLSYYYPNCYSKQPENVIS